MCSNGSMKEMFSCRESGHCGVKSQVGISKGNDRQVNLHFVHEA